MKILISLVFFFLLNEKAFSISEIHVSIDGQISVDGQHLERVFNGIGGLSGGGATSRLLIDYPSPYREQILDYLFLPKFGASLQILKVEIGGDCQTTDGTEPSHMHTRYDENFNRGYEWFLMVEAKKRNPNIKIYGLAWGVPGWIGNGNFFSEDNIYYHVSWVLGAKRVYDIDVDYIGIWNERSFEDSYIIQLRKALDSHGLHNTKIVAADGGWTIIKHILNNSTLYDAVSVVGVHYPGTISPKNATDTGKTIWASEDYSTYADSVGGGCWARILNQNYVNGYMTATISWNLIAAYYYGLPYYGTGLMWATNPWSGNYEVKSTIWVTAHTTQFTEPGWIYLAHGNGTGFLPKGGSYVTLVPPTTTGDFTMVIETMTHNQSICIRPPLPPYTVQDQTVTFSLGGGLLKTQPLHVWYTHLSTKKSEEIYFKELNDIIPVDGVFTLHLNTDSLWTITTTTGQKKGKYPSPPQPTPFPSTYKDNFENYETDSEARYFADQTGSWEIYQGLFGSKVMRQVVTQIPIRWCSASSFPITLIGDVNTTNIDLSVDALIETQGKVSIGARVEQGGCTDSYKGGYFLEINEVGHWNITSGTTVLKSGNISYSADQFHTLRLVINNSSIVAYIDGQQISQVEDSSFKAGFVIIKKLLFIDPKKASIGSGWNYAQFDHFSYTKIFPQ